MFRYDKVSGFGQVECDVRSSVSVVISANVPFEEFYRFVAVVSLVSVCIEFEIVSAFFSSFRGLPVSRLVIKKEEVADPVSVKVSFEVLSGIGRVFQFAL